MVARVENKYRTEKDDFVSKDGKPPHPKNRFFNASKGVGLPLDF